MPPTGYDTWKVTEPEERDCPDCNRECQCQEQYENTQENDDSFPA